ncbi:CoA pyrophosphatase [Aquibacillus sp. 3ASR75-11]|uniref:CoA pyrophosphatase n=1 Tax=Terrihalobacillus insolitus TaxID=2950438 RepID=A0A9X3WUJ7_9BACI|nr:CoA pyrophosphatase [Terrihalobacillus insolitus]MDC3413847.1 CoA pyrophosphatase [Terrihalobacillus insolitus]MDC3424506.1 CoA pyrophosphatase [Terrihalobacillus insolitus]
MDAKLILNKLNKHTPSILGSEQFSKFAVLLPLVQMNEEVHILFEIRSSAMNRQPGEICFPGGKMEPKDKTEQDVAIRETVEELGINRNAISDISPLDYLVSPFGMIVYPYVGQVNNLDCITPNQSEVEEVFTVPLSFFLEKEPKVYHVNFEVQPEENFPFDLIAGGRNYNWRTSKMDEYFYVFEDKVIWGLTARILVHFIELVRKSS